VAKAGDESCANGIGIVRHDNRNRSSCLLGGAGCLPTGRDDDVYLETHKLDGKRWEIIEFSLCISILNENVAPLHIPKLAQPLPECLNAVCASGRRDRYQVSDPWELLRLLGQRHALSHNDQAKQSPQPFETLDFGFSITRGRAPEYNHVLHVLLLPI
jgi:hypothetical protein